MTTQSVFLNQLEAELGGISLYLMIEGTDINVVETASEADLIRAFTRFQLQGTEHDPETIPGFMVEVSEGGLTRTSIFANMPREILECPDPVSTAHLTGCWFCRSHLIKVLEGVLSQLTDGRVSVWDTLFMRLLRLHDPFPSAFGLCLLDRIDLVRNRGIQDGLLEKALLTMPGLADEIRSHFNAFLDTLERFAQRFESGHDPQNEETIKLWRQISEGQGGKGARTYQAAVTKTLLDQYGYRINPGTKPLLIL